MEKLVSFTTSKRGSPQLVYNNHVHTLNKKKPNGNKYWICAKGRSADFSCSGSVTTDSEDRVLSSSPHVHGSNIPSLKAKEQRLDAIRKAVENPLMRPRRILGDVIENTRQLDVSLERSSDDAIKKAMRRARNKSSNYPPIPKMFSDLMSGPLPEKFSATATGEPFLLCKDFVNENTEKGFIVFMSPFGKQLLSTSSLWCCDGTFYTAVDPFKQVFIICGRTPTGKFLPGLFALLPDKEGATYLRLWETLKIQLQLCKPGCAPQKLIVDFELGVSNSFHEIFPEASIAGCYFHFRQSIRHQLGLKGCLKLYDNNESFQQIVDYMISLAFVRSDKIVEYFELALESKIDNEAQSLPEEAGDFFDYFIKVYIGRLTGRSGSRRNPLFAHSRWSIYSQVISGEPVTNNALEAWNGQWNSCSNSNSNSNIWAIIQGFKREDAMAKERFYKSLLDGEGPLTSRQEKFEDRWKGIKNAVASFDKIPAIDYLAMIRKAAL